MKLARNLDTFYSSHLITGNHFNNMIDFRNAEKMISEDGKSPHTAHTVSLPEYQSDNRLRMFHLL
jgi:hypothetical protein